MIYKVPYSEDYDYSFYNPQRDYMLVFSDKKLKAKEVKIKDLKTDEFEWFLSCRQHIIKTAVKEKPEEMKKILNSFLDDFEKALREEIEK